MVLSPNMLLDDRYELQEVIGRGDMANVWRGRDRRTSANVAVKIFMSRYCRDRGLLDRFRSQIGVLYSLAHPGVVQITDAGETHDGRLYLVLPLLDGIALDSLLADLSSRGETIPWQRLVVISRQICGTLQVAHGRGIFHHHLKPSNVNLQMLPDGREFVRILDFWVARVFDNRGARSDEVTRTTMVRVKEVPHYTAPELGAPAEYGDPDGRADLFSLGVIMYEFATGSVPFPSQPRGAPRRKIVNERPPTPTTRAPERAIPKQFDGIIMRALAMRPEDRFANAKDLDAVLAELEQTLPADATPRSDREVGDIPKRRGPRSRAASKSFLGVRRSALEAKEDADASVLVREVDELLATPTTGPSEPSPGPSTSQPDLSSAHSQNPATVSGNQAAVYVAPFATSASLSYDGKPPANGGRLGVFIAASLLVLVTIYGLVYVIGDSPDAPSDRVIEVLESDDPEEATPAPTSGHAVNPASASDVQRRDAGGGEIEDSEEVAGEVVLESEQTRPRNDDEQERMRRESREVRAQCEAEIERRLSEQTDSVFACIREHSRVPLGMGEEVRVRVQTGPGVATPKVTLLGASEFNAETKECIANSLKARLVISCAVPVSVKKRLSV